MDSTDTQARPSRRSRFLWAVSGILLFAFSVALMLISWEFDYDAASLEKPIPLMTALLLAAGFVYLFAATRLRDKATGRGMLWWIVVVGALMRLALLPSNPMLETDYYRYLWDGALTAHAINPYRYSPQQALEEDAPPAVLQLAIESGPVVERVSFPHLRTVYPPVAQAFFAAAYWFWPWNVMGLRLVFLLCDAATLALLLALLRTLKRPLAWAAVYWWCPLVVKEIYNSTHLDIVIMPFVLGALLLAARRRYTLAAGVLALAVGAKLWPVLLLPVALRPVLRDWRKLIAALGVFGALVALMFWPVYVGGLDDASGFAAYAREWEMNDALYLAFFSAAKLFQPDFYAAHAIARAIVAIILTGIILRMVWRRTPEPEALCRRALAIVAALFLLSPTQFPWYYIWVLPLVAMAPRTSLILLAVLPALYYLRFYFSARGVVSWFDNGVVWLEFGPVLVLLGYEWFVARRKRVAEAAGD